MNGLIKKRALRIFELTSEILMSDEGDDIHAEAAKYSYLVLRGAPAFRNTFNEVGLELDFDKIAEAFWLWRLDIPLPIGLLPEEIKSINYHNEKVLELYKSENCRESFLRN